MSPYEISNLKASLLSFTGLILECGSGAYWVPIIHEKSKNQTEIFFLILISRRQPQCRMWYKIIIIQASITVLSNLYFRDANFLFTCNLSFAVVDKKFFLRRNSFDDSHLV